jgi:hypothetical protein
VKRRAKWQRKATGKRWWITKKKVGWQVREKEREREREQRRFSARFGECFKFDSEDPFLGRAAVTF